MDLDLNQKKIGIIGGNDPCCEILDRLFHPELAALDCQVLMVADPLVKNQGTACAERRNIPTSKSYAALLDIAELDLVLKLKNDKSLAPILTALESRNVKILDLDPYRAVAFIGLLKTEGEKAKVKAQILDRDVCRDDLVCLLDTYSESIAEIFRKKTAFLKNEKADLLELEKELTQVIQGSMIPTFIINNEHILTHWNPACEKLSGHNAYELVGTDRQWVPFRSAKRPTLADMVVDGLDESEIAHYFGTSWRRSEIVKEALEAEEFFPHLGENGKWIFFTAAPIKSPDGKVIGAIETLRDRSEDKAAQKEIALQDKELVKLHEKYKKSEEKYRSLFNNNPNPIFIVDSKSLEVLDINHRVEVDYGYSKSDLLGTPFLEVCDKDDDTVEAGLRVLGPGETLLFTKKKHKKKSGEYFFTDTKVVNTTYSNRNVLIAASTDITESVEKETQLIQAGKLATLGTMAAGMAHEINQPLNVIQICADLMIKMMRKGIRIPDDELKLMANDIIENVARAAGVIKHVRDFARQSERSLKKLDINAPVNDVFKVLGHQITAHAIQVELNLSDDLPQVRAEHNRLEQVFINLVTNAIDAMDEKAANTQGPVEKRLTIKTWGDADQVCVSVSDTGTGMSESVRRKIFEPFFTTKETGKGTGLGTSISFGIIKDYSGTIEINSEEGQGSEFIIRFPAIS